MEMPPITDRADDILSSWTALEVLSPSTFKKELDLVSGDKGALAIFAAGELPWEISQGIPKKQASVPRVILRYDNHGSGCGGVAERLLRQSARQTKC